MYIETQILGDKERRNKIVRYGFETHKETAQALGCIGVAKALYFKSSDINDKNGSLTLPLPSGPIVCKADTLSTITGEIQKRARLFQFSPANQGEFRLLSQHMSRILWLILNAVNSSELRLKVENRVLPSGYFYKIEEAMHLMRAIGAGKKIGQTAISQLLKEPKIRPIKFHEAVIAYEQTDSFSASFPLNVKATIATSLFDEYP